MRKFYTDVFFSLALSAVVVLLVYQIYVTRKITQELEKIRQTRIYYIQFLNAVTMHLKKKILAQPFS